MLYEKPSSKTIEEIELALRDSAGRHKFGVLYVHDLQKTMHSKGVDYNRQVAVFEVCNPHQAKRALEANPAVSTMLPCRISVYEKDGRLTLSTVLPAALMAMFGTPELEPIGVEVEAVLKAMIDEAA